MFHLVYTSYSTAPFSEEELVQLLNQSRVSNKKLNITGMLVYLDNKFIQVLEGEREAVVKLYQKIASDPRHKRVALLLEGNTRDRIFKDWSMGFKKINNHEFGELTGFKNVEAFFNKKDVTDESPAVLIFLKLFYKKNYVDYPEEVNR